jgi:hypothetical protein
VHQELDHNDLAADVRALASVIRDIGGWVAELEERVSGLEKGLLAVVDVTALDDVVLEGGPAGRLAEAHQRSPVGAGHGGGSVPTGFA